MTPIKSNLLKQISDSLKNQTFNGVYPVSRPVRGRVIVTLNHPTSAARRLTG